MHLEPLQRTKQLSRAGLVLALYGAIALAAILIAAGRDDIDIYRLEGVSTTTWLLLSPVLGLVLGLLVVWLSRLATRHLKWAKNLHRNFRGLLGELTGKEIFIIALASSVGEELLFRGALQPALGLWLQAAIFGLLHIGPSRQFLPWTLWAFAMGVIFGLIFRATGDLGAPIVAHFVINYLNLHYISRVELPEEDEAATKTPARAEAKGEKESGAAAEPATS